MPQGYRNDGTKLIPPSNKGTKFTEEHKRKIGLANIGKTVIHNLTHKRPHRIWRGMKNRCLRKADKDYHRYGGRGIKICDRWMSFVLFWEDMKSGYKENLTIDRINNEGDYEKSNCKWSTPKEQAQNRRPKTIK